MTYTKEAQELIDRMNDDIASLRQQLAECERERDELVADAKRYRWVRAYCELIEYGEPAVQEDQDSLDAAVDATLAKLGAGDTAADIAKVQDINAELTMTAFHREVEAAAKLGADKGEK